MEAQLKSYAHLPSPWNIYDSSPAQVRHILENSADYRGDGAFSVVIGVDSRTVLKVSTCQASQIILPSLMRQPQVGMPLVFKCFGQVGEVQVADDKLFIHAYLIERLNSAYELKTKALRTDVCPRGVQMHAKTSADAVGAYHWLERKMQGISLGIERTTATENSGVHPLVPAFHQVLHGTRFSPLIGAVRKLAARVSTGEWTFDLVQRFHANVMISDWGEPILADPVYSLKQPMWKSAYPEFWEHDSYYW